MEKCLRHPGRLQRIHPGGVELYHLTEDQVLHHPGRLKSPWYRECVPNTNRVWSCCKASYQEMVKSYIRIEPLIFQKTETMAGCKTIYLCCRQDQKEEGCRKRYACCQRPTDFSGGGSGCELMYSCCRKGPETEGCQAGFMFILPREHHSRLHAGRIPL